MGAGQIWLTALDLVYEDDIEQKKGLRFEGIKVYRWVSASAAINSGQNKALLFNGNFIFEDGSTPEVFLGSGITNVVAGVYVSSDNAPQDSYFWVQVKGPVTLAIGLEGTPGSADALTHQTASSGTLTKRAVLDQPIDAYAVIAASDIVYLNAVS